MKQQNEKQRTNKPSTLLSQEENDLLFSLLGRRCQVCTHRMAFKVLSLLENTHSSGHWAQIEPYFHIRMFSLFVCWCHIDDEYSGGAAVCH